MIFCFSISDLIHKLSKNDEFGVRHVNLMYNKENGVCFCLLDAPDHEAVVKHHDKVNIQCEWIVEVDLAKDHFSK